jgi:hypothetical protein
MACDRAPVSLGKRSGDSTRDSRVVRSPRAAEAMFETLDGDEMQCGGPWLERVVRHAGPWASKESRGRGGVVPRGRDEQVTELMKMIANSEWMQI